MIDYSQSVVQQVVSKIKGDLGIDVRYHNGGWQRQGTSGWVMMKQAHIVYAQAMLDAAHEDHILSQLEISYNKFRPSRTTPGAYERTQGTVYAANTAEAEKMLSGMGIHQPQARVAGIERLE